MSPDAGARAAAGTSVLRESPLFFALAVAVVAAASFADPDLGMHIEAGRVIFSTGHIPTVGIFSYTAANLPWRNHEWLAEAAIALAYDSLGVFGLRLLKLICGTVTIAALSAALSSTRSELRVQQIVLLLVAIGILPYMEFRPQLFTYALLSVEMAFLSAEVYGGKPRLWVLVPIFAVWADIHGGFIAGLGALGVVAFTTLARDFASGAGPRRGLKLFALMAACGLATLANPFGLAAWTNVLHSVNDPFVRMLVPEWAPLWKRILYEWSGRPSQLLVYLAAPIGLMCAFGFSLVRSWRGDDLPLVIVATLFSAAGLSSSRYLPLAVITLAAPLAFHLALAARNRTIEVPEPSATVHNAGLAINRTVLGFLVAAIVVFGQELSNAPLRMQPPCPVGAVTFMEDHKLRGNILNQYEWGSYLVFKTAPASKVFLDGRTELLYPDSLLYQYVLFFLGRAGGKEVLDRYPHDLVLVEFDSGGYRITLADPRWRLAYRDGLAALFVRNSPENARNFPAPVVASTPPALFP